MVAALGSDDCRWASAVAPEALFAIRSAMDVPDLNSKKRTSITTAHFLGRVFLDRLAVSDLELLASRGGGMN